MTTTGDLPATAEVSPGPLIRLSIADCGAKVLQGAVRVGVFTALASGPATESEIRERTGLHPRFSADFLDALVGLGLLDREDGAYRNSPLSTAYLVEETESYLGGFIELTNETLYDTWGRLPDALISGEPQTLDPDKGGFFGDRHENPDKMKRFLKGLDAFSDRMGTELAACIDWSGIATFTDLGGSRGNLSSVLARTHRHLTGVCFDLPRTQPLFEEHMGRLGLTDRVTFQGGDFFADELPSTDVVVLGHILHGFDSEHSLALLKRIHASLRPGGQVLIYDRMIDDDRRDSDRLLSSLHMKLVSQNGQEYRVGDCVKWLHEAGFAEASAQPLLSTHTLVIGRKGDRSG